MPRRRRSVRPRDPSSGRARPRSSARRSADVSAAGDARVVARESLCRGCAARGGAPRIQGLFDQESGVGGDVPRSCRFEAPTRDTPDESTVSTDARSRTDHRLTGHPESPQALARLARSTALARSSNCSTRDSIRDPIRCSYRVAEERRVTVDGGRKASTRTLGAARHPDGGGPRGPDRSPGDCGSIGRARRPPARAALPVRRARRRARRAFRRLPRRRTRHTWIPAGLGGATPLRLAAAGAGGRRGPRRRPTEVPRSRHRRQTGAAGVLRDRDGGAGAPRPGA